MPAISQTTIDPSEAAAACDAGAGAPEVGIDDRLLLPMAKRMLVQYAAMPGGGQELRLFHGIKEVSFDDPAYFAFGETLARQTEFRAGSAMAWGQGYAWEQVRDLLARLLAEGVLVRPDGWAASESLSDRQQPSPLPPSACPRARSWAEVEEITRELAGRAVELGHLELFIPIFRVAHAALDSDGRQVGEANVFPRGLRLEIPTEWWTCIYPGTRYRASQPMNVSALKGMREHWRQMMAALHRIRAAYLRRFPEAAQGWTVGHLERLATTVLAVPTYQLMRCDHPVASGDLHPALSSLFRVTDGLRMVMHQMLFVPVGEPTLSPTDPVTAEAVLDYADRNFSFHSPTGVCAGPRNMVRDFLAVLVDGDRAEELASVAFDPPVAAALEAVDAAIDYAMLGLQAYAVTFSLWPLMTRTYEQLAAIAEQAVEAGATGFAAFRDRMVEHRRQLRETPFLATEAWRADREHVYADMYQSCGRAVARHRPPAELASLIAPARDADLAAAESAARAMLTRRLGGSAVAAEHVEALVACLMDYVARTRSILREAAATQACINRLLERPQPRRPFSAADMDVHNRLQGTEARRLPYLLDEVAAALGLDFFIEPERIVLRERDPAIDP